MFLIVLFTTNYFYLVFIDIIDFLVVSFSNFVCVIFSSSMVLHKWQKLSFNCIIVLQYYFHCTVCYN